jgi:hypothetical protein
VPLAAPEQVFEQLDQELDDQLDEKFFHGPEPIVEVRPYTAPTT